MAVNNYFAGMRWRGKRAFVLLMDGQMNVQIIEQMNKQMSLAK